ncbi:MAG: beta-L-arabinofuranosidase domain-containing protein, partial [Methylobacter sp.]
MTTHAYLKIAGFCTSVLMTVSPILGETALASDQFTPLPFGNARLDGRIGHQIDALIKARYTSDFAQKEIYPETAEALRQRVDDVIHNKVGLWQGEFWGKWILGAIAAQRYTGEKELKEFIRKAVREALATQDPSGYIGTYSKTDTTRRWNVWCMKYTLWGLVEAYELLGEPDILVAARRQMDYLMTFVGPGKTEIASTGDFSGFPSSSILQPLVM